jgi:hypothetical protein
VGNRFGSGQFSLERCGQQVRVGSDFVGWMWVTGSSWEGFFREMWAAGLSWE